MTTTTLTHNTRAAALNTSATRTTALRAIASSILQGTPLGAALNAAFPGNKAARQAAIAVCPRHGGATPLVSTLRSPMAIDLRDDVAAIAAFASFVNGCGQITEEARRGAALAQELL
jgi:hypothetical protein